MGKELLVKFPYHYPCKITSIFNDIGAAIVIQYKYNNNEPVNGGSCKRRFETLVTSWKKEDVQNQWASGTAGEYEEYDQVFQELSDLYSNYIVESVETKEMKEEERKKLEQQEQQAEQFRNNAALKWSDKTQMEDNKNKRNKNKKNSTTPTSEIIDLTFLEEVEKNKLDLDTKRFELDRNKFSLEERRLEVDEQRVAVDLMREQNRANEMAMMKEMMTRIVNNK